MKITIEPTSNQDDAKPDMKYPTVTISLPDDDLNLDDVLEMLVNPALQGFGYSFANVVQHREVEP